MHILQIKFPKAQLDAAPEAERLFHLMAGKLANDLNILTKLLSFAMNKRGIELLDRANLVLDMFLFGILAGKLTEGWKMIRKQFLPIKDKYESDLEDVRKDDLKHLELYFGNTANLIKKVRSKVGFHYDDRAFLNGYNALPDDEILVDYFAQYIGHCIYYSSEISTISSIVQLSGQKDPHEATEKFLLEYRGNKLDGRLHSLVYASVREEIYREVRARRRPREDSA